MTYFKSKEMNEFVEAGKIIDENSREFIRGALGLKKKKVESTRHTILSGPPGVGKTFGTEDECIKGNVVYIKIEPGMTDVNLAVKLATAVYSLPPNQDLIVILDDADDVVFGKYETLNKWKIAMADVNNSQGIIPTLNHPVSMNNTIKILEQQVELDPNKAVVLEAVKHYLSPDSLGLSIPTDRVRFVILCNLDLEDPKSFRSARIRSAVPAIMDRVKYKRINVDWTRQWGWTAYVLLNSQPFSGHDLSTEQKVELLAWMKTNWEKLRSTSYRTVRRLAEAMINEPEFYLDEWNNELKGN